jgi:hypothetical protein
MFEDLNGVWLLTAGGMFFGFLGVLLRYGFKTKCDQIDICWGLIKIHRDIRTEAVIETTQIENGINPDNNNDQALLNHNSNLSNQVTSIPSNLIINAAGGQIKKVADKSNLPPKVETMDRTTHGTKMDESKV